MTRLKLLCNLFGWQGGTIHQAKRMLQVHLKRDNMKDIVSMSDEEWNEVLSEVVRLLVSGYNFKGINVNCI